jgi:hypothetical protein
MAFTDYLPHRLPRTLFGARLSKYILPIQDKPLTTPSPFQALGITDTVKAFIYNGVTVRRDTAVSTNGAQLDYCEFRASDYVTTNVRFGAPGSGIAGTGLNVDRQEAHPIATQKVIIHVGGDYQDHIVAMGQEAAYDSKKCIVGFNFRNVASSPKAAVRSESDFINDVIAMVDLYKSKGVPFSNICLQGHGAGAEFAIMAADRIQQREKDKQAPKVIAIAAFSSRPELDVANFKNWLEKKLGKSSVAKAVTTTLGFIARPMLNVFWWVHFGRVNAAAAFKRLPAKSADYITIKDDQTVLAPASLHSAVKNKEQKQALKKQIDTALSTNRSDAPALQQEYQLLKDRKVASTVAGSADPHVLTLWELTTYNKLHDGYKGTRNYKLPAQLAADSVIETKKALLLR